MALLKNTIFIALLLLCSFEFAKCQSSGWEGGETVTETTEVIEWYQPPQEEAVWNYPTEETPIEEIPVIEETVVVEEEETGSASECPKFIEETEVNGHWMTFHPCCVSAQAACSSSHEPVCLEELRCEAEHCRRHYETVTNVCLACKGQGNWMYSIGACPWE